MPPPNNSASASLYTPIWRSCPKPRGLADDDFDLDISQKGVDMRIGLHMAMLAVRQTVRAVIVVTGGSDFVPAFKFVRREGVRFILEPMGHNFWTALREHSDIVLPLRLNCGVFVFNFEIGNDEVFFGGALIS